jgi:SPP1 family predicted phage head-tail adaptor
MRSGQLRNRITIEAATEAPDTAGQPIRTWSPLVSRLPAKVEQVSGGETIRSRQVSAGCRTLITVRYRTDVTSEMRVVWEGRTLGIVAVRDPYGTGRELWIECVE